MVCRAIPDVKRSIIKNLVYEHVLDQVLSSNPVKAIADNILTSLSQEIKDTIQAFISPLIVELKNRLPSFSITKVSLNTDPFDILQALKHILSKYESLIAENPNPVPQTHELQPKSSQDADHSSSRKKGKGKERAKVKMSENLYRLDCSACSLILVCNGASSSLIAKM
ncbi:unnamed protein product [Rhizopus stolonifer]